MVIASASSLPYMHMMRVGYDVWMGGLLKRKTFKKSINQMLIAIEWFCNRKMCSRSKYIKVLMQFMSIFTIFEFVAEVPLRYVY